LRSSATVPDGPRPAGVALEDIAGVGPTRRRKLLAQFGGLDGVQGATIEDLCRVEGINRTLPNRYTMRCDSLQTLTCPSIFPTP
jgi:DNA integrity scanning protein DisA with diadenylate cyclase activity